MTGKDSSWLRALPQAAPACACLALGLVWPSWATAQTPVNSLVFTVGTVARDNAAHDWSYLLVGSTQPELVAGKRFAVYGKPGFSTNAGTFTLRGEVFQQTSTAPINSILNLSVSLGDDLLSLSNSLNTLLRSVPGVTGQPLAQKVLTSFQAAATNPDIAGRLALLARTHAAYAICAGQAFSEQISAVTTYEVREVNPGTGTAGDVIGRVTVVPGTPVVLPAPGAPFQLVRGEPGEHLNIRLRWGTPDTLRRLSLLGYGFNVWRIPKAAAQGPGYDVTPPTLSQLYSDSNFTRVNNGPVPASRQFLPGSGPGAANDPADTTTYFLSDDNGARFGMAPFADGAQFYYFVTARDILGRDGLVSSGGLAQACRRLPPGVPQGVKVENNVQSIDLGGGIVTNQQRLLVSWIQNTNPVDQVAEYWVYRWPNPAMAQTNDAAPLSYRIGVVPQAANSAGNQFLDTGPGAPVQSGPASFWYTVRAVSQGACDSLLSAHSGPAWGVLRQRAGPEAAEGNVYGSCGTAVVVFQGTLTNAVDADISTLKYLFTCQRRDPGIAWVQFFVTNRATFSTNYEALVPVYFSPDEDVVQVEYVKPIQAGASATNDIGCVVGTFYDATATTRVPATFRTAPPGATQFEAVFLAGQLLETALTANDPLVAALNGAGVGYFSTASATPDPSGTVGLTFNLAPVPLGIQALDGNTWNDLGVVYPDSNGVYWVSYPACIVGPLQPFRGYFINLPASSKDCDEHIARASNDGAVAPVQVHFTLTPRTKEYRLYRRVDDGPMTLISQGAAVYNSLQPLRRIVRKDDAMPPSAASLCYYVQLIDQNGNGSPMKLVGCKQVKPAKLPRPVLAEPKPGGSVTNPLALLNWFCPTSGVYRFQIKVERADQPSTVQVSVFGLYLPIETGFRSAALIQALNFNNSSLFGGLKKVRSGKRIALSHFDEAWFTQPVTAGFGPGPQFTLDATVVPNVPYNISVAAVDAQGHVGESSLVWKFTWVPPILPQTVPWPARPVPPVHYSFHDQFDYYVEEGGFISVYPSVSAGLLYYTNSNGLVIDTRNPVGITIGDFSAWNPNSGLVLLSAGTTNLSGIMQSRLSPPDPNLFLFKRKSGDPARNGNPLLPLVVYRQQVTNDYFPRVSGALTQVTPLIERLPIMPSGNGVFFTNAIADPLIGIAYVRWGFSYSLPFLVVKDQLPVARGAEYQYWVARLNSKREIDEVFYAGYAIIPPNL